MCVRPRPGASWDRATLASLVGLSAVAAGVAIARGRLVVVTVRGLSMSPTLSDGDRVLVDRKPRCPLAEGDIVVLQRPHGPEADGPFIKRVVGLAGDPLPEDVPTHGTDGRHVPPGHIVVKGDFAYSVDSRIWGCVPVSAIDGVVIRRLGAAQGSASLSAPGQGLRITQRSQPGGSPARPRWTARRLR